MLPSPVPADPGWDEDLTWLDCDPVTAAEFEASLDRLCERDEGPGEEECGDVEPFTAGELAEIREAAADELLAAKAASTGRRGPGSPVRRGSSPASRAARRRRSGRGWHWTCCRAAPAVAVAADAAAGEDGGFGGVSEAELVGMMCGWDRVRGARARPQARRDRRAGPAEPRGAGRRVHP